MLTLFCRTGIPHPAARDSLRASHRRPRRGHPHRTDLHLLTPSIRAPPYIPTSLKLSVGYFEQLSASNAVTRVQLRAPVPRCGYGY